MRTLILTLVVIMIVTIAPQTSNSFRISWGDPTIRAEAIGGVTLGKIGLKTRTIKTWMGEIKVNYTRPDNVTVTVPNKKKILKKLWQYQLGLTTKPMGPIKFEPRLP